METQSDSIDITSIKFAALGAFEPSKAANFEKAVSSSDRLKAIQHAFQCSVTATVAAPSQHTAHHAVDTSAQPAQHVTQQSTFFGLASTVPETPALIDTGNPTSLIPYAAPARVVRQPKKMSTQDSLPQDTQPVSQSIYEGILNKAKSVRQPDPAIDEPNSAEVEQDSLQEGDEGHIDLLSSYKPQDHEPDDDSDAMPADFSPTQTQPLWSQFPESDRFKTPGTTTREGDYNGDIVQTPSLPRNPLARTGAPTPAQIMGLSQAFAATQAVSSPLVTGFSSGPQSDRPSPNIELQTRPAAATLSSPLRPIPDLRKPGTEPYSHYKSIQQSQAERERLSLFAQHEESDPGDTNISDDDFDEEPSLVERRRRLKEREEKVRQQFQAVSSPAQARSRGSTGLVSSPTSGPQLSSPRPSLRPSRGRAGYTRLTAAIPEEPSDGLTDLAHESEEETEQEEEVEIARSSQMVVQAEEDKENLEFAGLQVPETIARLQGPIHGSRGIESSPSTRQLAGLARGNDTTPESNGREPFAVANSQPSQSLQGRAHQQRTQLNSSADDPSFVPQSQVMSGATHMPSSPVRNNLPHSSTNVDGENTAEESVELQMAVKRTSSGNGQRRAMSDGEIDGEPASSVQSPPRQEFNDVPIAETDGGVVQARRFASWHAPTTETTVPETSSLGPRESDLTSSAPQLDRSKPASSSSGRVLRSSGEFDTAQTHLSTTAETSLLSLPRQPSYVTASPSGRKRRRMTEITADLSPRKSGSELDMDVAMAAVVDKEFEAVIGSSSPIPPGRYNKRRRLRERQTNATVEQSMRTVAKEQETEFLEPEKISPADSEDTQSPSHTGTQNNGLLHDNPHPRRATLQSTNTRHELSTPAPKKSLGRVGSRLSRPGEPVWELPTSPEKPDAIKSKVSPAKSQQPPSTMPVRKGRTTITPTAPSPATQIGRPTRQMSRRFVLKSSKNRDLHTPEAPGNTSSGCNPPSGDIVAPNQVLACFNGKTRAYYPATCLGVTGSDSLRYQIQWEGFEADETDADGIRKLDLRIGDLVKVNLEGFPKVSHVVRGFKDKVLLSEKNRPMTDIRGYSVLLVAPKQRKSLPTDLSADTITEVPVSAIYLDSNMWGQMKGREYEYTPHQNPSIMAFATPPERPSTPATPSSRSRRNLAVNRATAPAEPVGIFSGMAFAISYDEARKSSLTRLIRTNGGMVLLDGFHELFASEDMTHKPNFANLGFTALLADRHSRKEKYMQALALNLPCLSGKWIESCVAKQRVVDWQPYLLPAGESAVLDGAIRSRILSAMPEPRNAKMVDMIETRPSLLKNSAVIFVTGRGKAEEKRRPFVFLTQAIGAGRIEKVADLHGAKTLLHDKNGELEGYKWVFVDDSQLSAAENLLRGQQGNYSGRVRVEEFGRVILSQSLDTSLPTIPPFFNHIYAILAYPRGENSLLDMGELSLEAEGVAALPVVLFQKKSSRPKGSLRKRSATPISSQTDDAFNYPSSEDDWLRRHRVKHGHQNTGVIIPPSTKNPSTELFPTIFQADCNVSLNATNDATKRSNWFDENTKIGPTQASTNVRITTVTDFAPDVCKDYKTTGWCGFGDSCKFLHDRSDYKQGWQLDREWENVTKGKKNLGGTVVARANRNKAEDGEDDEKKAMPENIPFACFICKEAYKSPVVTRCGHYFCESCALERYTKDPTCAACGAPTNGVFNSASKLKKLLDRKRKRAERL